MINLIKSIILEAQESESQKNFVANYVGNNQKNKISEEEFRKINELFNKKFNFVRWMVLRIVENKILFEDLNMWKDVIDIFNQYKNKFVQKDLNQIVSQQEVDELQKRAFEIKKDVLSKLPSNMEEKDAYLSPNQIDKLSNLGVIFHGIVDGYQLFEVTSSACQWTEQEWIIYKNIMGQCKNREQGAKIQLCTMAGFDAFRKYLCDDYPNSSYFNIYKKSDQDSPYQFHYESAQFMNKDNVSIL